MQHDAQGRFLKKYTFNETYFNSYTKESCWLAGLLAADGNIINEKGFSITQSGKDGKRRIVFIKKLLQATTKIAEYKPKMINANTVYSLSFFSSLSVKNLYDKFNITKNKSLTYEFPLQMPERFWKHFIQGYIEGDGCIGVYNVGNSNKFLILQVIGTKNTVDTIKNFIPVAGKVRLIKNKYYDLRYTGKYAIKSIEYLFSDLVYSSKFKIFKTYRRELESTNPKTLENLRREKIISQINDKPKTTLSSLEKNYSIPYKTLWQWKKQGKIYV